MSGPFGFHTNHFGISEEELEYDENDPSWLITSPGANVLLGGYESAKPFIEKIQHQQRSYLEKKLEERRELRETIRERVSQNFDEKLKQHMANFQPKARERLVLELFLSQQKKELEESFRERLSKRQADVSNSISKPAVLEEPASMTLKSQLQTESLASFSTYKATPNIFSASSISIGNLTPTVSVATSTVPMTTTISASLSAHVTSACPSSLHATPKIQQPSDFSFAFCAQKTSSSTSTSSPETFKSVHATLTRTDSVSSCKSSASRSTSWPLQQIVEEKQSVSNDESFTALAKQDESRAPALLKLESRTVNSEGSDGSNVKNQCHQIYENEIAFARTFVANTTNISDSVKNELKCTIKEKISVSTKKFAKQSDITQIVRFFSNLLNGLTVYGFKDKMVNLKDDELARNWAMVHIINTYLDLVPQDVSLLKVITAILSSLASSSVTFSKLLCGKLFIASPLLAVNHNECLKCIMDFKKRSERFAETIVAWHSREISIINLFIALKMSNQDVGPETTLGTNGLALMWKMIAVTASDSSPFGATLITEILKQHWKIMHAVYGRQMEKLVILIEKSVLPRWRSSLQKITPNYAEMNEMIQSVAESFLTSLSFTVDDCLSSFRS